MDFFCLALSYMRGKRDGGLAFEEELWMANFCTFSAHLTKAFNQIAVRLSLVVELFFSLRRMFLDILYILLSALL